MRKFILPLLMTISMAFSVIAEDVPIQIRTHQNPEELETEWNPIIIPIKIFFDSENNLVKVWCDNDNIQAQVFIYDETGSLEEYSPDMNVVLPLSSNGSHTIIIQGDDWYAEGEI